MKKGPIFHMLAAAAAAAAKKLLDLIYEAEKRSIIYVQFFYYLDDCINELEQYCELRRRISAAKTTAISIF